MEPIINTSPTPPVEFWEGLSSLELGVAGFFIIGGLTILYKIFIKSLKKDS